MADGSPHMTRLLLVPSGLTDWHEQHRIAGDTDLPLSAAGIQQAHAHGPALAPFNPTAVYSGSEEAARQTASLIAKSLGLRTRAIAGLKEVSLGHWQGLAHDEFEERFERVDKVWRSEPLAVTPPEGESLSEAETRLCAALQKLVKRKADETLVIVLGPLACAVVRSRFAPDHYERFWEMVEEPPAHHELDVQSEDFTKPTSPPSDSASSGDA